MKSATNLVVTTDVARELAPVKLTANARVVLEKRYLRRGADGQPVETIEQMFDRVARVVAEPDGHYGADAEVTRSDFYDLLASLRFIPNSPTFSGAGTPLGQLAACFVLPIVDDMGRDPQVIFSTLRAAALVQQTGGGNGFGFSRLRPKGDVVHASSGKASGPVGFLRVYDRAFGEVAQGGTRRGANMGILRVDHPDIESFVTCKSEEGQIANFNLSVGITDAFMRAVEADQPFDLVNPRDGKVWKTVQARDLFRMIVSHAYRNGEPGALFLDTANRANPLPQLYELEATNPCGEQTLGPYECCCLGAINLAQHLTTDHRIDWVALRRTIEQGTHFLDNVIDANQYVPAVPEIAEAALRSRRIGLGIVGLGDVFYRLGVRYGSKESVDLAGQIMEFVRFHAMLTTSAELAAQRGPFPAIRGSIYDAEDLKWSPPQPLLSFQWDWNRPAVEWDQVIKAVMQHGIRNAAQTTVAPTGTVATVAGIEAYGCEPVFALAYTRHVVEASGPLDLDYVSPLFQRALEQIGLDEATRREIVADVSLTGSCQHVGNSLPAAIRNTFVIANDVPPAEHVLMQAAQQAFVDNAISKTINVPSTATADDVAQVYQLAWQLGCKGLTVYVTGSRHNEILETKATSEKKTAESAPVVAASPLKKQREHILEGKSYKIETPLGTAYITINRNGGHEPFEIFCNIGKAGSDTAAVSEAIGRLVSLMLRLPSALTPTERLQQVVEQLSGIGGRKPMGFGAARVRSLPDGIAQVLEEELGLDRPAHDHTATDEHAAGHDSATLEQPPLFAIGDLCPSCGSAGMIQSEGCSRCVVCGHAIC